jgi:hypothetical protein
MVNLGGSGLNLQHLGLSPRGGADVGGNQGASGAAAGTAGGGREKLIVSAKGLQGHVPVVSPFAQYQGEFDCEEQELEVAEQQQHQEQHELREESRARSGLSLRAEPLRQFDVVEGAWGPLEVRGRHFTSDVGDEVQQQAAAGLEAGVVDGGEGGTASTATATAEAHPVMVVPRVRARKKVAGQIDVH